MYTRAQLSLVMYLLNENLPIILQTFAGLSTAYASTE